jgi:putative transposase
VQAVVAAAFLFRRASPRPSKLPAECPARGFEDESSMATPDFQRKPHRLPRQEYCGERWYFVTMCSERRAPIFADPAVAKWLIEALRKESELHSFLIDAYCLMPDHLHFLAVGITPSSNFLRFVKSFKQKTAYLYVQKTHLRLWQRNYYDHILRSNEEPRSVAAYIWLNPVRRGICKDFEQHPYSGSFSRPARTPTEPSWTPPWKHARMPA